MSEPHVPQANFTRVMTLVDMGVLLHIFNGSFVMQFGSCILNETHKKCVYIETK